MKPFRTDCFAIDNVLEIAMLADVMKSEQQKGTVAKKNWSHVEAYRSPLPGLPFEKEGSTNLHAYVGADPVNFTDPSGLQVVVTGERLPVDNDADNGVFGATFGGALGSSAFGTASAAVEYALEQHVLVEGIRLKQKQQRNAIRLPLPPGALSFQRVCSGVAEFTAVGGNQARDAGALAGFGIRPVSGTVAVDPNQFGVRYGGSAQANMAAQARFAPVARGINIISVEAGALSARYGGPSGPSFGIGDVGDKNVRSGNILRLDLYRFPTVQQGRQFGRQVLPVLVTGVPEGTSCPPGTAE